MNETESTSMYVLQQCGASLLMGSRSMLAVDRPSACGGCWPGAEVAGAADVLMGRHGLGLLAIRSAVCRQRGPQGLHSNQLFMTVVAWL